MKQTRISAALRREVRERAGERCEYCLLVESQAFFPHEPDHLIALKHGGKTLSTNLALARWESIHSPGKNRIWRTRFPVLTGDMRLNNIWLCNIKARGCWIGS